MGVGAAARARRHRWHRRLAVPLNQALPQRRLFLLPTRFGAGWAVLVLVLVLFGINYQNTLAYILAFWLFALATVTLLRTWRNLLGIRVSLRLPHEVFAGSEARLGVVVSGGRARTAVEVHGAGTGSVLDLPEGQGESVLAMPAARRGVQPVPLLRVESRWPLGLVRALAWIDADQTLLIYPQPHEDDETFHRRVGAGLEASDFAGLRRAEPGDSPARLAWKQWSRTGVLSTKVFSVPPRQQVWLDYDSCQGDPERRLSTLCARVLVHHSAGDRYGLRLPGSTLPQGQGARQRREALEALARFDPELATPTSTRWQ
ncbi:DUF58 domain-containing protein [Halomonas urumqiensis]|uniref:DUF58 domain-containing protein n=1 Tax=Halomonas urumqiensis TaxID=1684789 RepID=A0A2N7UMQ9_9GAMM|nr:DUF58 domain-containing protein [Halomonas urumqiensis]PMR81735.1 DUF58 domain-containing protein [Halomonas urumqiensis]PTB02372.1 DUF58 domain-containing protein [Halomonas urumqiensis]GHE21854.1 hypothetical protein GCM10017767_23750 [Halomonas urumqiensis]